MEHGGEHDEHVVDAGRVEVLGQVALRGESLSIEFSRVQSLMTVSNE